MKLPRITLGQLTAESMVRLRLTAEFAETATYALSAAVVRMFATPLDHDLASVSADPLASAPEWARWGVPLNAGPSGTTTPPRHDITAQVG
jgi:hypothetical protein